MLTFSYHYQSHQASQLASARKEGKTVRGKNGPLPPSLPSDVTEKVDKLVALGVNIAKMNRVVKSNPEIAQLMTQQELAVNEHSVEGSMGAIMQLAKRKETGVGAGVTLASSWEDATQYFKDREELIVCADTLAARIGLVQFANSIAAAETFDDVSRCPRSQHP